MATTRWRYCSRYQIPEGGITSVEYGFINGAGRYYRGADFGMSSRFLTDNAGDFFVGLSIAYVDDERRSDTPGDPFVSIMNQEEDLDLEVIFH